jgi:hypothetical protein
MNSYNLPISHMSESIEFGKSRAPQFLIDVLISPEKKGLFGNGKKEEGEEERVRQLHTKASSILRRYGKREKSRESTGHAVGFTATGPERFSSFKKISILRTPPIRLRRGNQITDLYLCAKIQKRKLPEIVIKTGMQSRALYEYGTMGMSEELATIQEDGSLSTRLLSAEKTFRKRVDFIEKTLDFIEKDLKSKK